MEEINAEIGLTQILRGESGLMATHHSSDAEKPKAGEKTESV